MSFTERLRVAGHTYGRLCVGIDPQYNALAGQASKLGVLKKEDANIENYVTNKTMDGLYKMIATEEKAIRADPVGTGSAILKKVFAK